MGTASSSIIFEASSNGVAVLALVQAINEETLQHLKLAAQCKFCIGMSDLAALFPDIAMDAIEQTFAVFDSKSGGNVDSCEILASLVLAAPLLSRESKHRVIFEMFNVSTHRVGLLVADEATLLFRTMAVGTAKLLRAIPATASPNKDTHELPPLAFFENLTKTLYGEQETLTFDIFAGLCQLTPDIEAVITQFDSFATGQH